MGYTLIKAKPVSYGGTRALSAIKYIVIHYTGVSGDTAKAECNYFANGNTRSAGAHYFVDKSGAVVQSIPLNLTAWSVGGLYTTANGAGAYYGKCVNNNSVSIELCDIVNSYPSDKQVKALKKLVKFIKKKCPNAKTIIRHWDVNGKLCPARMAGKNNAEWKKLTAALDGVEIYNTSSYQVKITKDKTPVRKAANGDAAIVMRVNKGEVYTIVKESGNWLKLKSGAGWIHNGKAEKI